MRVTYEDGETAGYMRGKKEGKEEGKEEGRYITLKRL
jgi:flagellar biosynthesis/type III secretory pathway protein FliH